jgi:bifunctional non-homologous end joining protein LigD
MLVELEGHRIEIARPEKWVWYEERYTILDLVRYYVAVAPWLLPHLQRRPIVYEIYPGTVKGPNSFEQDPPSGAPAWVKRVKIPGRERVVTYVIVDCAAALVYLVSLFMVTLHVWESTTKAIEKPDFLLLDLDPSDECTVADVGRAALRVRDLLNEIGFRHPLVKTSGARGLHVVAPLEPQHDYATVRAFTQRIAQELAHRYPDEITSERDPRKRAARTVHVDWGQLGRGMTIVAPYSPRACPGAPVSMPVHWDEIERYARSRSKRPPLETFGKYTIGNAVARLKACGDVWADMATYRARLPALQLPQRTRLARA